VRMALQQPACCKPRQIALKLVAQVTAKPLIYVSPLNYFNYFLIQHYNI
jgi:hypothetical protein